jgi:hypothetical protein
MFEKEVLINVDTCSKEFQQKEELLETKQLSSRLVFERPLCKII